MTNLTLRSLDIPTLYKHAIGYDSIFDKLMTVTNQQATNYPPYNVIKHTEDKYSIEIAVAGFRDGDIDIEVDNNQLTVRGSQTTEINDSAEYLHRGIGSRSFLRTFTIGEYVEVTSASIQDGILNINLERIVPEEKKPKKIAITYTK